VGVVVYDEALRLTECNEWLAAMLGVPLEDSLGFDLTTLHTAALLAALRRPLAGREGQWVGSFSSKITGAKFHISLSAAPLRAPGEAITGGIAVIEDLTERQRFLGAIEKLSYEDP
jgi:PAS domain S-box-containing protein